MIENKKTIDRGKRYPRIVKGLAAFHRKHWSLGFLYDDVTVVWYENDTSIRDVLRQLLGKLIVEQPQPINNSFVDTVEYVINLRPTTITPPAPISQIVDWYYEIARVLTAFENAVTGQGKFTHSDDLKGDIQRLIDSLPMEDLNQQLLNPTPTRSQSYNHLRIYRLLKDFFKTL